MDSLKKLEKDVYVLLKEDMQCLADAITEKAVEKGIEAYKEEHKKHERERDRQVRNSAKVLITNYRRFKSHCENASYDQTSVSDDSLAEIMELMQGMFRNVDFEILSIKEKVIRTRMIMDHVDTMLGVYKHQCETSTDPDEMRRYRIIESLYLKDKPDTVRSVAEREAIDTSTVYRDCERAYKRLAILFFGIDGVKIS